MPRLAGHPPWKQFVVITVALPVVVVAAVLAFAWPAARVAPRDLPVGVAGTSSSAQRLITGLNTAQPGAFDFRLYADERAARDAIEERDIYGAFVVTRQNVTVLVATAASPAAAQLIGTAGESVAARESDQHTTVRTAKAITSVIDVVPLSGQDPKGTVLSAALLPLTICSILIAAGIGIVVKFRPAWRQIVALVSASAVGAAGVYFIAQTWLGALPHDGAATWASLAGTILAISSATAGLIALAGPAGLAIAAALLVFIGNPFSGVTSAPELLPNAVNHIGQWLPPGAGAGLIRTATYFGGNAAGGHVTVLITWIVLGFAAVVAGHHAPIRFAASATPMATRDLDFAHEPAIADERTCRAPV
jgi:hypothetical protein